MSGATKPVRKRAPRKIAVRKGHVLVLRVCDAEGKSYGGFTWPTKGPVKAPDWSPVAKCGRGLHGWLWGAGDIGVGPGEVVSNPLSRWLVLEVSAKSLVDLGGKIKFPRAVVLFCGPRADAVAIMQALAPRGTVVLFGTATAGYGGTATAGYGGTATAGDFGTATAGPRGTATAGYGGTATAGYGAVICLEYHDGTSWRRRVAEVDAAGPVKPGKKYRLSAAHEFEQVSP